MVDIVKLSDAGAFLALNNSFARETSFLEPMAWVELLAQALFAIAVEPVNGFLLAFDETADYRSPNFLWFKERFDGFVYIDRVVIAEAAQGVGVGRALYEYLFAEALAAGFARVVCEVNIVPPNPRSIAFHERMGFTVVGENAFDNDKIVRYFQKSL